MNPTLWATYEQLNQDCVPSSRPSLKGFKGNMALGVVWKGKMQPSVEKTVYGIRGFGDDCWSATLGQVVTEWAEHVCW